MPLPVADLAGRQQGDAVVLEFTLPARAADGRDLGSAPDVEIYRWFYTGAGVPAPEDAPTSPYLTIPGALADTYIADGQVRFTDPLPPELLAQHAGVQIAYLVRTRASERHASQESNVVVVRIFPAPERPAQLTATVTAGGVELRWRAVERTTGGARLPAAPSYRVYRAETTEELPPGEAAASRREAAGSMIGVTPTPLYRDTQAEFGRRYTYWVSSVAQFDAESVESARSEPVELTARDTFAPAPPEGLVAVLVPATAGAPAAVELSWSISAEPDLAGYRVYRSEQAGERGARISAELLLTPVFRDAQVAPGRRYFYSVTAADRAGNESPPGAPVTVEIPTEKESVAAPDPVPRSLCRSEAGGLQPARMG